MWKNSTFFFQYDVILTLSMTFAVAPSATPWFYLIFLFFFSCERVYWMSSSKLGAYAHDHFISKQDGITQLEEFSRFYQSRSQINGHNPIITLRAVPSIRPPRIKAGWTEREPDQTAEKNLYRYEQYGFKQTVTILNHTDAEQKSSNGTKKKGLAGQTQSTKPNKQGKSQRLLFFKKISWGE